jgi:hypothetical protein
MIDRLKDWLFTAAMYLFCAAVWGWVAYMAYANAINPQCDAWLYGPNGYCEEDR